MDGLHCPGRFAISLFFIVLYNHIEGYTEHVDFHGPTFSLRVDIAFLDPVILTQCTHSYAHFWLPHACCCFDFSGGRFAHVCQKGDQHGHVSWHIQASQCFDEFQIFFIKHLNGCLSYYNPSRFIHISVIYKYFLSNRVIIRMAKEQRPIVIDIDDAQKSSMALFLLYLKIT